MIKIDFEFQTEYGVFCDAIHLLDGHGLTEAEIDTMKQERVDNWIAVVKNPPTLESAIVQDLTDENGFPIVAEAQ